MSIIFESIKMKKIKKQDQKIIQKKIDGLLTANEEEYFDKLISNFPEARDLYRQLAILHHSLEYNSGLIPEVNLTDEIMQSTKDKKLENDTSRFNTVAFLSRNRRQVLAYAAIFLFGIMLGGFAFYLSYPLMPLQDTDAVSGTMSKSAEYENTFYKDGTGIKILDFKSNSYHSLLVSVETNDTVYCVIPGKTDTISPLNINLLHSEGKFIADTLKGQDFSYRCTGENVFLVNNLNGLNTDCIRFYRKNVLIYDYKTE
jgi:hypothetical protein